VVTRPSGPEDNPLQGSRELLDDVTESFDRRSIRWAVHLAPLASQSSPSRSLLLISEADKEEASQVLVDHGFVQVSTVNGGANFLAYSELTDEWVRVDLLYRLWQAGAVTKSQAARGPFEAVASSDSPLSIARIRRNAAQLLSRHRGVTVAILAPDGAGKSSVATGLLKEFGVPVQLIYMGRARERRDGQRGSVALGLLRQWRRYLRGSLHRFKGSIVLFDRYTYDALLPPRRPTAARIARRWLLGNALPAPDVIILLDAPAQMMFDRKREHSAEFLAQRRQDYLALQNSLPQMVVVNAAQSLDDVRRDVTRAIWNAYRKGPAPPLSFRWNHRQGRVS
jgi:hypothetical protein